jgi:hypothetical protein
VVEPLVRQDSGIRTELQRAVAAVLGTTPALEVDQAVQLDAVQLDAVQLDVVQLDVVQLDVVQLDAVQLDAVQLDVVQLDPPPEEEAVPTRAAAATTSSRSSSEVERVAAASGRLAASPRRHLSTKMSNSAMATIVAHRGEGAERPDQEEAGPTFVGCLQHGLSSAPEALLVVTADDIIGTRNVVERPQRSMSR